MIVEQVAGFFRLRHICACSWQLTRSVPFPEGAYVGTQMCLLIFFLKGVDFRGLLMQNFIYEVKNVSKVKGFLCAFRI
jgi:hypothetical protein